MRLLRPLLLPALALLTLALSAVPPLADDTPSYDVIDLGTLGGERSEANAINNRGEVVGWAETGDIGEAGHPLRHAFLWDRRRGIRDLGALHDDDGNRSVAHDINNRGKVVGWTTYRGQAGPGRYACVWTSDAGQPEPLPLLNRDSHVSAARGINDRGQVVGEALAPGDYSRAVRWTHEGAVMLGNFGHGVAESINDHGAIVGSSEYTSGAYQAIRWSPRYNLLRGRGDRTEECYSSWECRDSASAINNRGEIVGSSERGPFLIRGEQVIWLGLLPGRNEGGASSINQRAQVVGSCWDERIGGSVSWMADERACLWQRGRLIDLNDRIDLLSGWVLRGATDINDRGQIVGYGEHSGAHRAFLLNPRR